MRKTSLRSAFLPLAGLVAASVIGPATPALASDQIGVYAVVRKVKYEPTAGDAVRVRLCGAFALSNINNGSYFGPMPGYMYYTCPTGQETLCRMQWKEIETAAAASGGAKCVAFGMRRDSANPSVANNNGRIRPPTEGITGPDSYPLGMGMVTVSNPSVEASNLCSAASTAIVDTKPCEDPPPDMAVPPAGADMASPNTGGGGGGGCSVAGLGTAAGAGFASLSLLLSAGAMLVGRRRRRSR